MKIKKKVSSYIDINAEIVDITLLSIDEYIAAKTHIQPISAWWWLRSPGYFLRAACVAPDGGLLDFGIRINSVNIAVRPALRLKAEDLSSGDEFIFGDKEWVYIDSGLAIAREQFCKMPFRKDWRTPDANDYAASDAKKYLEKWLTDVR